MGLCVWGRSFGEDGSPSEGRACRTDQPPSELETLISKRRVRSSSLSHQTNFRLSLRKGEGWGEGSVTQISPRNSRVSSAREFSTNPLSDVVMLSEAKHLGFNSVGINPEMIRDSPPAPAGSE